MSNKKDYVTLKDIAQKAGVSLNTVSRALKNGYDISEETKKKIVKLAKEMGYVPDNTAVSLRSSRSNIIGLVLPNNTDYFFSLLILNMQSCSQKYSYQTILSNTRRDSKSEKDSIKLLLERRVDGLIIWPSFFGTPFVDYLKKAKIPFVILGRHFSEREINEVYDDQENGAYEAVKLLFESGCTNVFFVKYKDELEEMKINGIKKAYKKFNSELQRENIIEINPLFKDNNNYFKEVKRVIQLHEKKAPLGFLTVNNEIAIEMIPLVSSLGKKIPEDISIIAYTDTFFSKITRPPLTTISVDVSQMAEKAFLILINNINRQNKKAVKKVLPVKLIKRGTTMASHSL